MWFSSISASFAPFCMSGTVSESPERHLLFGGIFWGFCLCLAELEVREGAAVIFWSLLGPFSAFFHCTLVCFASFTPFRLVFLAIVAPLPVPYTPRLSPKTVRSFSFGSFAKCSHVSVLPLFSFSLFRCAVFGVPRVLTLCLYAYVTWVRVCDCVSLGLLFFGAFWPLFFLGSLVSLVSRYRLVVP